MLFLKSSKLGRSDRPARGGLAAGKPLETSLQDYPVARRRMIEEQLVARGITEPRLIHWMSVLPRHVFVEEALRSQAYQDSPLNIGFGQTISQPYTVARLALGLHLTGQEKVLEIGTGCGYQTAVLSGLCAKVYSIERIRELLMKARTNLKLLGIQNVVLRCGDGSLGWPEMAPFDAIVAAAVSPQVPEPLLNQLKEGGHLVMPIERGGSQFLVSIQKVPGGFTEEVLMECRFVKMVGRHGFQS